MRMHEYRYTIVCFNCLCLLHADMYVNAIPKRAEISLIVTVSEGKVFIHFGYLVLLEFPWRLCKQQLCWDYEEMP